MRGERDPFVRCSRRPRRISPSSPDATWAGSQLIMSPACCDSARASRLMGRRICPLGVRFLDNSTNTMKEPCSSALKISATISRLCRNNRAYVVAKRPAQDCFDRMLTHSRNLTGVNLKSIRRNGNKFLNLVRTLCGKFASIQFRQTHGVSCTDAYSRTPQVAHPWRNISRKPWTEAIVTINNGLDGDESFQARPI